MRTHRFGRKIKLPSTIAIKHEVKMLMTHEVVAKAEAEPKAAPLGGRPRDGAIVK
jgi:hypothetical protein